ncbi:serine hydroxymethyltransferase [Myxococcota bacterium]|nr:serine hydroxymethyltransferase [Myxococcota bacterium]MBU1431011.1 serine hydroxymethyltransferase [Myxococcota bacterium]MBU1898446.1 serine hydroxymethyltransferase [Myxococcota bacterium]
MSLTPLHRVDPEIAALIDAEADRQRRVLRLIPSENYASSAVLEATGSVLTNKYSEGYAGRRYYQGQAHIDAVERLAIKRAKALFGAEHANVQPYSGSPANLAVYHGLLEPGDRILSLSLPHGGHLTHGWKVTISGKVYDVAQYGVRASDQRIDMDEVARMAKAFQPKLIVCGASAYPRVIDFEGFAQIAADVGAYLLADMAHIAGLVAGGVHPSPVPFADVVSTTTHKTLRGPRGGMLLCKKAHRKAIDRGVFPGLQGGPHNHTTAAIAVALGEASTPEFKAYARAVVDNARALAEALLSAGFDLVSGGTDNHLMLLDLTAKGITGKAAAAALDAAGIVGNANSIPFDPRPPMEPSGLRIGTPAITSMGMGVDEMKQVAAWIAAVLAAPEDEAVRARVRGDVEALCQRFPAPGLALS